MANRSVSDPAVRTGQAAFPQVYAMDMWTYLAKHPGEAAIFNEHKADAAADWLVFCHQDFVVFDDDWIERITRLPQDACYGPIGVDRARLAARFGARATASKSLRL